MMARNALGISSRYFVLRSYRKHQICILSAFRLTNWVIQIVSFIWSLARCSFGRWAVLQGFHKDHDREFVRSLWTIVPFTETFLQRVPKEWQENNSRFSPKLAPTAAPISLSFIAEIFGISEPDQEFVRDILQVDPDKRQTAGELLQQPWLNS